VPIAGLLAHPDHPVADEAGIGEEVPYYYSSKYARLDALPSALDCGETECLEVVRTYIGYVFDPPDGAGGPLENALHLRGACARLRVDARSENASLLLLDAFSLLAVEASASGDSALRESTLPENPAVRKAVRQVRTAYRRLMESAPWPELLAVLTVFADRLAEYQPALRPLLEGLRRECVLYRTVRLLRTVNRRLLHEPSE
jgi:hypothetical protein